MTWTLNWIKREVASWSEFVPCYQIRKRGSSIWSSSNKRTADTKLFFVIFLTINVHRIEANGKVARLALQDWPLKNFISNFKIAKILKLMKANNFNPFYNERVMCIRLRVAPTNPRKSHFAPKNANIQSISIIVFISWSPKAPK